MASSTTPTINPAAKSFLSDPVVLDVLESAVATLVEEQRKRQEDATAKSAASSASTEISRDAVVQGLARYALSQLPVTAQQELAATVPGAGVSSPTTHERNVAGRTPTFGGHRTSSNVGTYIPPAHAGSGDDAGVSTLHHNATLSVGVEKSDDSAASAKNAAAAAAVPSSNDAVRSASICGFNTFNETENEKLIKDEIRRKKTKIIATIGPASVDEGTVTEMFQRGVDAIRFNISHSNRAWHQRAVDNVRRAAVNAGRVNSTSLALDSRGPEIRVGQLFEGKPGKNVVEGDLITLSTNPLHRESPPDATTLFVTYSNIAAHAQVGARVLFDHGNVELFVVYAPPASAKIGPDSDDHVKCQVITSKATIRPFCKVHLPGWDTTDIPSITDEDREDFAFAVENAFDAIFVSFCHNANDIAQARQTLADIASKKNLSPEKVTGNTKLFAKIQDQTGVAHLDEIIAAADGIVVARHDLCADFPPKKIFALQKYITARCLIAGKPAIVLSQMLGSMVDSPHPSSTSCIDAANAVVDGADAITLSDETALGKYPVEAVTAVLELVLEGEKYLNRQQFFRDMVAMQKRPFNPEEAVASSAVSTAAELNAKAIVALTTSGASCQLLAKYAPPCPVIAVCRDRAAAKLMQFVKGVVPHWYEHVDQDDREARLAAGVAFAKDQGFIVAGDTVVFLHADLQLKTTLGHANVVRVATV